ncbi:MAG: hypothetical protein HC875_17035 [Anaerolineales bacterium]|nr:hypothetical protein [Anaerolineales bacterium]
MAPRSTWRPVCNDKSQGGDVVISEKLWRDPAVAHLLDTLGVNVSPFATSIKGFDEHFSLFRLALPSESSKN